MLDEFERLLLIEGHVIANDRQLALVVERGAWVDRRLVAEQRRQRASSAAAPRVSLAQTQTLFDRWEKAQWDLDSVLCLLAARQAGWPAPRQQTVVAAALSMTVAMLDLQAHMAEQDTPPAKAQFDVMRAVAERHERADVSGYPRGLTEACDEARVLRMADVYRAKITPRARRPLRPPLQASRQLFQQEPGSPLAMALIKAIGVHPPGCLVQLKSGEVAVVKRRGAAGPAPVVCTLSDKQGKPSIASQTLDSADPAHAIAAPYMETSRYARVLPERVYGVIEA